MHGRPLLAAATAAAAVWAAYAPALGGPFLFDDLYQPFTHPGIIPGSLTWWLIRERPVQMLSFALNYWLSGPDPFSYHVFNLLIHLVNAWLVYRVIGRLAGDQGQAPAAFAAALFLLHPVQTEAVSYVSGRAYSLSATFFLSALSLFLTRPKVAQALVPAVSTLVSRPLPIDSQPNVCATISAYSFTTGLTWPRSAAIVALFAAAVATKEHTLTLPVLLLFTDCYWGPGGWRDALRRNRRLYLALAACGVAGAAFLLGVLARADTAGAGVPGLTPLQYFATQCRLVFTYLRLFLFPAGQTIDPDIAMSRSLADPGAVLGLAALLLLLGVAWRLRRQAPLTCYGVLVFLLLLAPTSSFIPIADPLAERRLYLPMLGLLCIPAELLARLRPRVGVAVALAVLLAAASATHRRNQVWTSGPGPLAGRRAKSSRQTAPSLPACLCLL